MISLCEMFFGTWHNYGEKTSKDVFSTFSDKKWTIMNDSNIIDRAENLTLFNSKTSNSDIAPSINQTVENSIISFFTK